MYIININQTRTMSAQKSVEYLLHNNGIQLYQLRYRCNDFFLKT